MAETIGTVACVGNPIADKGHGEEAYERAFDLLGREGERYGFAVMDLTGGSFEESLANARQHAELYDALVVVGGDGMIALGANAIGGSGKPLGIVAVGSGNDFARGLELPVNRIETAVEGIVGAIACGTSLDVDMGHVTGRRIRVHRPLLCGHAVLRGGRQHQRPGEPFAFAERVVAVPGRRGGGTDPAQGIRIPCPCRAGRRPCG